MPSLNYTPFVSQYTILSNKWGAVHLDSSGIGALMGRYKRMKEKGGKVMICGVGDRIRRVLRIAAIDTLLPEIEKKEKKS